MPARGTSPAGAAADQLDDGWADGVSAGAGSLRGCPAGGVVSDCVPARRPSDGGPDGDAAGPDGDAAGPDGDPAGPDGDPAGPDGDPAGPDGAAAGPGGNGGGGPDG